MKDADIQRIPPNHALPTIPRAWRPALLLAVLLHGGLVFMLIAGALRGVGAGREVGDLQLEPLPRGRLAVSSPSPARRAPAVETPIRVTETESAMDTVRGAVSRILEAARKPAAPDALSALARKVQLLERISSADEVTRMAALITQALGAEERSPASTTRPAAGPFDFDHSLMTASRRNEDEDVVRISETLTDPAGRTFTIVSMRTLDPQTGAVTYQRTTRSPGSAPSRFRLSAGDFRDAVARHRPFNLINRFPLVRQLHRQAVLPILRKLAGSPDRLAALAR